MVLMQKWFEAVQKGQKTHELRALSPFWQSRLQLATHIVFSRGCFSEFFHMHDSLGFLLELIVKSNVTQDLRLQRQQQSSSLEDLEQESRTCGRSSEPWGDGSRNETALSRLRPDHNCGIRATSKPTGTPNRSFAAYQHTNVMFPEAMVMQPCSGV